MNKIPNLTNIPGVWIGDYCIRPFDDDQFVLEHIEGEAVVADKERLEPFLKDLFEDLF